MSGLLEKLKNLVTRRDDQQAADMSKRARPDTPAPNDARDAAGGGRRGFGEGKSTDEE